MSKYLLIPVEEIEKQMALYQKAITESANDRSEEGKNKFIKFTGKYYGLDKVYELGKQISLDEKDIEEKAVEYSNQRLDWRDTDNDVDIEQITLVQESYKQALKDLL